MVDGVQHGEQLAGLVAVAQGREGEDRPDGAVGVLAAVLADARQVALDVARIDVGMVERRGEEQDEAVVATDEVLVHGVHRPLRMDGLAAPDRTLHDWAIESIRHSALTAEPSGVPSSKKARRYQSPSQPSRSSARRSAFMWARQRSRAGTLTAVLRDRREGGQDGMQEPAQPDALAAALVADPVHAVVPVARPHERQPVRADGEAPVEGRRTVLEQRRRLRRPFRLEVGVRLVGPQRRSLDEWDDLVEDRRVARDREVAIDHVRQPEAIVRDPGPDAPTRRRMPPVLDVALGELVGRGPQEMLPGRARASRSAAR